MRTYRATVPCVSGKELVVVVITDGPEHLPELVSEAARQLGEEAVTVMDVYRLDAPEAFIVMQ